LTPLDEAALRGQKDAIELFLSKGAKVNAQDDKGNTPLLWALLMAHTDAAEIMIAAGADVNLGNAQGLTPLFLARRRGYGKIEDLLRQHGAQR
jgi:ankyrin repeat protein